MKDGKSRAIDSHQGMGFDGAVLLVEIDLLDGKHEKTSVVAAKSGVRHLGKMVQSARGFIPCYFIKDSPVRANSIQPEFVRASQY